MSPFSFWVTMVKYVPILRISTGALNSGFSRANQVGLLLLLPTQDVNQLQVPQPLPANCQVAPTQRRYRLVVLPWTEKGT